MKKNSLTYLLLLIGLTCFGQDNFTSNIARAITEEGKKLYRSEMASWYGTDVFLEKYTEKEKIAGYFSYADENAFKTIFFLKGLQTKVACTISFDSTFNTQTAKVEIEERNFTKNEQDFFVIRSRALLAINSDSLFKTYQKTSLNLIPIISGSTKKVYVLTGPKENGSVIFGNDYLLSFDETNNLTGKKQLHKNIIWTKYSDSDKNETVAAMHTHIPETGDFITPTDICTLMLYEKFTNWKQYMVISAKYVSIWNCEENSLMIISTEEFMKSAKKDRDAKH